MKQKLLVIQRVITSYRYKLLEELLPYYDITIISSKGEDKGTLKLTSIKEDSKISLIVLNSLNLKYTGESRSTSLFFYPQVVFYIKNHDLLLIEGTTNLLNNVLVVPFAKFLGKKLIWWDAGYSLPERSIKRKAIDAVVKPFIKYSNYQIAYSNKAKEYMQQYMNASNCHALINTVNTKYFEVGRKLIIEKIKNYKPSKGKIKLLYVGAIEERKKIKQLVEMVYELNNETANHYSLTVIGGGNYFDELKNYINKNDSIVLTGPLYNLDDLAVYYFSADLFVMPGDGGLAIVQALLFGLPAICTIADGTEEDYLDHKYIFNNLSDIKIYLKNFDFPNKLKIVDQSEKLYSSNWVKGFLNMVKE